MKTTMFLTQLNEGQTFKFSSQEPLKHRGKDEHTNIKKGDTFKYITVCEGTTPKILNITTGEEHIYSPSTWNRKIILNP